MIDPQVVQRVLVVEAVLILLTLLAVFGHAVWHSHDSAVHRAHLERGREALVALLASGDAGGDLAMLRDLPRGALAELLAETAPSLGGPHKELIVRLAARLGLTESATWLLHSPFWWRRLEGARLLTLVSREPGPLASLARDPHPLLRAQLAEALGLLPSARAAEDLIGMLDDEAGSVRFAAKDSLMRLGALAQGPVARALELGDEADRLALLDIAAAVPDPALLPAAQQQSHAEAPPVRVRAARLLRAIGAPAALDRLAEMLGDASADVRAAAATALGTAGHWPAASAVARLLDDEAWEVRTAASVALQRLGPPGELLLRRARGGTGPGAEVARQVLEIAERLRLPSHA